MWNEILCELGDACHDGMRRYFAGGLLVLWVMVGGALGADVRGDFLKMIDRPRVPLAVEISKLPTTQPVEEFHFSFASDATTRVPGILIEEPAAGGRRPVVIALHGTGGTKNDELPLLRKLAERGFIGVAIDGPWHGERSKAAKGSVEYQEAIFKKWKKPEAKRHPFYYDTVWDVMRLIDYLSTRDDVDVSRIGLYGVSKGGIETYLTAAIDQRVAVAVPCIGLESFKWALDNNDWQTRISTIQTAFDSAAKEAGVGNPTSEFVHQFYERVVPGIDGEFDGPNMVLLIAPRPMMAINGDSDSHTPLPGLKLCTDAAEGAYRAAGVPDHFVERIEEKTAHKVTADSQAAAIGWFEKWMGNK
jgi:dienelactone hydrolase